MSIPGPGLFFQIIIAINPIIYNTYPMTFEVMSHSAMYNLAHCQLVGNVASGALWMPMGNPANAFRSDFPVEGRPHSIGKPNMSLCVSLSIFIQACLASTPGPV